DSSECQQQLDRTLADIARAPTAAGVLLQPARRQVMHERVLCEPRNDVGDAPQMLAERPRARRGHLQLRRETARLFDAKRRRLAHGHQLPANPQCSGRGGRRDDTYIWLFPGPAVCEQELVAADTLKARAAKRRDGEAAVRKTPRRIGAWRSCNDDVVALAAP